MIADPTQVVFAFGGTGGDGSEGDYVGDLETDLQLVQAQTTKQTPGQLSEAVTFYDDYLNANPNVTTTSVTGHSLGGAIAEYVAENGSIPPTNGITFEAPGIKQFANSDTAATLINNVDVNDPIGNFDGFNTPSGVDEHVGQVNYFDTPNPIVDAAISEFNTLMGTNDDLADIAAFLTAGGPLAYALINYHLISGFASALGINTLDTTPNTDNYFNESTIFQILDSLGATNSGPYASLAEQDIADPQQESDDKQTISFTDDSSYTVTWNQAPDFDVVGYVGDGKDISVSGSTGVAIALGHNDTISAHGDGSDTFIGSSKRRMGCTRA